MPMLLTTVLDERRGIRAGTLLAAGWTYEVVARQF